MLNGVRSKKRLGVCLDTCHLLAAGYDLCSEDGYAATFERFEALIGLDRLKVFHVNDSKKPCQQPGRSPRAHRPGVHRPRAVQATGQRTRDSTTCRC
jgi:endonuclease IV